MRLELANFRFSRVPMIEGARAFLPLDGGNSEVSLGSRLKNRILKRLLDLVTDDAQPNLNALNDIVKNVRILELNMKAFGYDLGRKMAAALPVNAETQAHFVGLDSKASTQSDIESQWVAHWAAQLKTAIVYHRKLWELTYVLQAIYENGHMTSGKRGLGFGCGAEPIPSYLAAQGVQVTASDEAAASAEAAGWASSNQHLGSSPIPFQSHLIDKETFEQFVSIRTVDMNNIPGDLRGYDFCWSICALEHLGSIDAGLRFIENSLDTLSPGGLAIHTLEMNVENDGPTIDNWLTVLYQKKHIEKFARHMAEKGHEVAPLNFDFGEHPMDQFIDLPPWHYDPKTDHAKKLGNPIHLKIAIDGFISTSFGIIIRKSANRNLTD
ncbi:hypothetical protein PX699_24365 [Sphingobium sp. H39-3-25]|nr:hypothetical protein [Sphingobium arseniciresistens]NLS25070.1 hypothetical protein [Sphingomonas sp. S2M10]